MRDLSLGDAHMVALDDVISREEGHDWVSTLHVCLATLRSMDKMLSGFAY